MPYLVSLKFGKGEIGIPFNDWTVRPKSEIKGICFDKDAEEITVPEECTFLPNFCFRRFRNLKKIFIHKNVTHIGYGIFADCVNLEKIAVDEGNEYYRSENNCLTAIHSGKLVAGCRTSVIPEGVVSIGQHAFDGCEGAEKLTLPESLEYIGEFAFNGCSNLKEINFPSKLKYIGHFAFSECLSLSEADIPSSVVEIGDKAFNACGLRKITFHEGLKTLNNYVFTYCDGLEEADFPFSLEFIGNKIFAFCHNLKKITLPKKFDNRSLYFQLKMSCDPEIIFK